MVSSVLSHVGHTVDLAADGWEGLVAADHAPPDLLIVEVKLPTADGWKLVETLRARPEMAEPAGAVPDHVHRAGPAGRLLPARDRRRPGQARSALEDLTARGRAAAEPERGEGRPRHREPSATRGRRRAPPSRRSGSPQPPPPAARPVTRPRRPPGATGRAGPQPSSARMALVGTLEQFGAASVLMLLDLERRSGVLIVTAALGQRPHLRARGARAAGDGRGPARSCRAALAVFELLTWSDGRFEFHAGRGRGRGRDPVVDLVPAAGGGAPAGRGRRRQEERRIDRRRPADADADAPTVELRRPREIIPVRLRVPPECDRWRLDHFLKCAHPAAVAHQDPGDHRAPGAAGGRPPAAPVAGRAHAAR